MSEYLCKCFLIKCDNFLIEFCLRTTRDDYSIILPAFAANRKILSLNSNNATARHPSSLRYAETSLNFLKQKIAIRRFFINENWWWEYACTNRAENKTEFIELMQLVKLYKEKWL